MAASPVGRAVFRGRGAGELGPQEERKFTFPDQDPLLQNKQDGGRGCWRGAGGLWLQILPRLLLAPPANKILAVSLGRPGFGPAAALRRVMGSGLSQQPCPCARGRGGRLDSVCIQRLERI